MQSSSDFTVGGSVSVNCHGWPHGNPPIADSVHSLRLVTTLEVIVYDRQQISELFRHVLGGYGLFGVITEVTLNPG
jgi:FAD/FMN-containing dehydrogenase